MMFILNEFFFPIMIVKVIAIILVLLVETTLSTDQQYEACEPRHCGDSLNVSFPFWIPNQHQSYCGHPGFEITCNEETPMIRVSNNNYLVRNISYEAYSVLVVHSDAYMDDSCPTPLHNISLNNAPFEFGPRYVNLHFFYNCTSTPKEYLTFPVPCATNASTSRHSFAAFLHQMGLEYLNASSQNCQSMVDAPVYLDEGITSENMVNMKYADILREGFLLNWEVARDNCTICETSGGRCGFERNEFICFCSNRPHSRSCSNWNNASSRRKKVIALTTGIGGVLAAAIVFFIWWSKQSTTKSILFWKRSKKAQIMVEEFLKNYGSLAPKRYNYSDIKKITNFFKDKVGQGGYGLVYKGELLDGRLVAVKLLNKAKGNGEEFINEVGSITRTSHVNVVSLLGFCFEGSKRALIYEFMPNGSLEKFIYDTNPLEAQYQLGWEMLYQITIGVARGLQYLHRGCNTRILHFDIKPHNILLDHDFTPKISDFGLAKLCPNKESVISMLDARGTAGYIAPEVFNRNFGGVSHKSDVYSYGMMVLEIVGRRKNINVQVDHTSEIYFPQWIYKRLILSEDLELYGVTSQDEIEIAKKMILIALWCIQTNPVDRPSMSRVVEMFEGRNELLQIPPKPYLCSPPRSPVRTSNT